MLSGEIGRSLFAGLVCTLVFAVVVPMLVSLVGDWFGISYPQGNASAVKTRGIHYSLEHFKANQIIAKLFTGW